MRTVILSRIFIPILFWLALPGYSVCQLTAPAPHRSVKVHQFNDSLLSHNVPALVEVCENRLSEIPSDTTYWRYLALANMALGRSADAEWCAYKRMQISRQNRESTRFYAKTLLDCGDYASAATFYERLQEELNISADLASEYGKALVEGGENVKARVFLSAALKHFASNSRLVNLLANVLANLQEYGEAIQLLNSIQTDSAGRHDAHMYKGYVFGRANFRDSALKYYNLALAEDSSDWWIRRHQLSALMGTGDSSQLRIGFENASRIDSADLAVLDVKAKLALLRKDSSAAERIYHGMVALNPKDNVALNELKFLLAARKNYPEYERLTRLILHLYPEDPEAYNALGDALEKSGKAKQALEFLQQGLRINRLLPVLYMSMAEAYDSLGDPMSAKGYIITGLQLYPTKAEFHQQLGEIEHELGDNKSALSELQYLKDSGSQDSAAILEREIKAPKRRTKHRQ